MNSILFKPATVTTILILMLSISIRSNSNWSSFTYNALSDEISNSFDHTHSDFDSLLKSFVHDSRVDYKGIMKSSDKLNAYLRQLGSVGETSYENWSEEQKLAFWINAYNAFTIKAIVDNYPIKRGFTVKGLFVPSNSILQIPGVWSDLKFRAVGRLVTLEEIEHEILRKQFSEPRIHFAINCASKGCPDLRSEAYRPDIIYRQLESQAIDFINDPVKGVIIDRENNRVRLSKIFKWFGEDFIKNYGNTEMFSGRNEKENAVLSVVVRYLQDEDKKEFVRGNNFKISYLSYDWSLNEINVKASLSSSLAGD
ncbi:MAG: DUF547 domain-containing protein [Thermodesulfobacteriota bacterium]